MIDDLSKTLKAILEAELPEPLRAVDIVFDRPDDQFKPSQTTVDMFLYDIRENVQLRDNEPIIERQNGQVTIRRPPLRLACSYLITVWPVSGSGLPGLPLELPLQEQYLLSQILNIFSKNPIIPENFLQGSLKGQKPDLPMIVAQTEGFKNPAEFWTAIGSKMHPSFTLTTTISLEMPPIPDMPVSMVIIKDIKLVQKTLPEAKDEFFHIGGVITDAENKPVKNATVLLVEPVIITTTNIDGLYTFGPMKGGSYNLSVQSDASAPKKVEIKVPAPSGSNYDLKLA